MDENFKTALFEIAPYAIAISESIKSAPSCKSIKKIDIEALDVFCKDITTLAELLCEMQVDKSIKVDIQRIQSVFDLGRINTSLSYTLMKISTSIFHGQSKFVVDSKQL